MKRGDSVRCVRGWPGMHLYEGGTYTVADVRADGFVLVNGAAGHTWWSPDRFEQR